MKSKAASVCEATGKIPYRDSIAAMLAMASCRHSRSGTRQKQRFYRCPFCHKWHLTKQELYIMRVSIFYNIVAPKPQETELDKIAYMMTFSQELSHRTLIYRDYLRWGRKDKAKETKITRFPAFCPCSILYDGKSRQNVMGLTDLCFLDIDHIEQEKKIEEVLDVLRNDKYVVMASRSVSGKGLHILIRYQLKGMEMPPQRTKMSAERIQKLYGRVYHYFAAIYQQRLGIKPDYNGGHVEHLFIVSYDPELYYNPNAETLTIDLNE